MPLSKAKERERWQRRKLQPNSNLNTPPTLQPNTLVLHLSPALMDWLIERAKPMTPEQYVIDKLEKAASRLDSNLKPTIDPMRWQA